MSIYSTIDITREEVLKILKNTSIDDMTTERLVSILEEVVQYRDFEGDENDHELCYNNFHIIK